MSKARLSPSFKRGARTEPETTQVCSGLVFIRNEEGLKIPLFLRSKGEDVWWDLPGGKRKINEHPFNAISREMREELGVRVKPYAFICAMPHPKFGMEKARNFIACEYLEGTPVNKLTDEHDDMKLCTPEEAISKLSETGRINEELISFIRSYVENQNFRCQSYEEPKLKVFAQ